jgi:hypothetical protein
LPSSSAIASWGKGHLVIATGRGQEFVMDMTALLLSRIQFAFTITFHIIFPSFTIGLAAWMTVLDSGYGRQCDLVMIRAMSGTATLDRLKPRLR